MTTNSFPALSLFAFSTSPSLASAHTDLPSSTHPSRPSSHWADVLSSTNPSTFTNTTHSQLGRMTTIATLLRHINLPQLVESYIRSYLLIFVLFFLQLVFFRQQLSSVAKLLFPSTIFRVTPTDTTSEAPSDSSAVPPHSSLTPLPLFSQNSLIFPQLNEISLHDFAGDLPPHHLPSHDIMTISQRFLSISAQPNHSSHNHDPSPQLRSNATIFPNEVMVTRLYSHHNESHTVTVSLPAPSSTPSSPRSSPPLSADAQQDTNTPEEEKPNPMVPRSKVNASTKTSHPALRRAIAISRSLNKRKALAKHKRYNPLHQSTQHPTSMQLVHITEATPPEQATPPSRNLFAIQKHQQLNNPIIQAFKRSNRLNETQKTSPAALHPLFSNFSPLPSPTHSPSAISALQNPLNEQPQTAQFSHSDYHHQLQATTSTVCLPLDHPFLALPYSQHNLNDASQLAYPSFDHNHPSPPPTPPSIDFPHLLISTALCLTLLHTLTTILLKYHSGVSNWCYSTLIKLQRYFNVPPPHRAPTPLKSPHRACPQSKSQQPASNAKAGPNTAQDHPPSTQQNKPTLNKPRSSPQTDLRDPHIAQNRAQSETYTLGDQPLKTTGTSRNNSSHDHHSSSTAPVAHANPSNNVNPNASHKPKAAATHSKSTTTFTSPFVAPNHHAPHSPTPFSPRTSSSSVSPPLLPTHLHARFHPSSASLQTPSSSLFTSASSFAHQCASTPTTKAHSSHINDDEFGHLLAQSQSQSTSTTLPNPSHTAPSASSLLFNSTTDLFTKTTADDAAPHNHPNYPGRDSRDNHLHTDLAQTDISPSAFASIESSIFASASASASSGKSGRDRSSVGTSFPSSSSVLSSHHHPSSTSTDSPRHNSLHSSTDLNHSINSSSVSILLSPCRFSSTTLSSSAHSNPNTTQRSSSATQSAPAPVPVPVQGTSDPPVPTHDTPTIRPASSATKPARVPLPGQLRSTITSAGSGSSADAVPAVAAEPRESEAFISFPAFSHTSSTSISSTASNSTSTSSTPSQPSPKRPAQKSSPKLSQNSHKSPKGPQTTPKPHHCSPKSPKLYHNVKSPRFTSPKATKPSASFVKSPTRSAHPNHHQREQQQQRQYQQHQQQHPNGPQPTPTPPTSIANTIFARLLAVSPHSSYGLILSLHYTIKTTLAVSLFQLFTIYLLTLLPPPLLPVLREYLSHYKLNPWDCMAFWSQLAEHLVTSSDDEIVQLSLSTTYILFIILVYITMAFSLVYSMMHFSIITMNSMQQAYTHALFTYFSQVTNLKASRPRPPGASAQNSQPSPKATKSSPRHPQTHKSPKATPLHKQHHAQPQQRQHAKHTPTASSSTPKTPQQQQHRQQQRQKPTPTSAFKLSPKSPFRPKSSASRDVPFDPRTGCAMPESPTLNPTNSAPRNHSNTIPHPLSPTTFSSFHSPARHTAANPSHHPHNPSSHRKDPQHDPHLHSPSFSMCLSPRPSTHSSTPSDPPYTSCLSPMTSHHSSHARSHAIPGVEPTATCHNDHRGENNTTNTNVQLSPTATATAPPPTFDEFFFHSALSSPTTYLREQSRPLFASAVLPDDLGSAQFFAHSLPDWRKDSTLKSTQAFQGGLFSDLFGSPKSTPPGGVNNGATTNTDPRGPQKDDKSPQKGPNSTTKSTRPHPTLHLFFPSSHIISPTLKRELALWFHAISSQLILLLISFIIIIASSSLLSLNTPSHSLHTILPLLDQFQLPLNLLLFTVAIQLVFLYCIPALSYSFSDLFIELTAVNSSFSF